MTPWSRLLGETTLCIRTLRPGAHVFFNVKMQEVMVESKRWMEMGFAFPCSFCTRMFTPDGSNVPRCTSQTCGGPFVGKSFPDYQGPLTRVTIATNCFRCGEKAHEAIVAKDGGYVGVCKKHLNSTVPMSSDTLIPTMEKLAC